MTTPYWICLAVVVLYLFYKCKLERRYSWKQFEERMLDPQGVQCSLLIYTDKYIDGIQYEYFYQIELTRHLADCHIRSKNAAYRRSRGFKIFTKH